MEINLTPFFVLPLVAGFKFVSEWEVTRYIVAREDGRRLYFKAAMSGFFICLFLYLLLLVLTSLGIQVADYCGFHILERRLRRIDSSGILVVVLILSPIASFVIPKILNYFVDKKRYLVDALEHNELELVLLTAVSTNTLIMASMGDGKVYVGFVYQTPDPAKGDKRYLFIIPTLSGYRSETHKVTFTTSYENIYKLSDSEISEFYAGEFAVVLPVSEIRSIRLFDMRAYDQFQSDENQNSKGA